MNLSVDAVHNEETLPYTDRPSVGASGRLELCNVGYNYQASVAPVPGRTADFVQGHRANGRLSTIDLSQGQRKRLALLEDRPIYVFDEWAADQEPNLRGVFYTRILDDLKRRGKTVIVITHVDRYFDSADKIVKLD